MTIKIRRNAPTRWLAHNKLQPDGSGTDDVFHVQFDPESDSVLVQIAKSVATIKNVDPDQLAPLGAYVDLDVLESFVDPDANSAVYRFCVSFEYEGLDITVNNGGDLWLEWSDGSP